MEIIPRSRWTTSAPGGAAQDADDQLGIAVHWPGTTADRYGLMRDSQVVSLLNGWRDYHMKVRGWSDIGYNYAIDPDGSIWELRGMNRIGAHSASAENPDANDKWIGVLFILGDREPVTSNMIQAFRWLREQILKRFPRGKLVRGHGQIEGAQTECPGPYVRAVMSQLDDSFEPDGPDSDTEDEMTKEEHELLVKAATQADYATKQLNSVAAGMSMLTSAMIDGTVDITELRKVNAELSGRGEPGLSHGDPTPEPVKKTAPPAKKATS